MRRALVVAAALLALSGAARADFAVVTHDSSVYQEPQAHSRVLARLQEGDVVELVSRRSDHGYYQVRFGEDEMDIGYLYRRFFRARVGDPGFVASRGGGQPEPEASGSALLPARSRGAGLEPDGTFDGCPIAGNVSLRAANHDELVALNRSKNRSDAPKPTEIDPSVALASLLEPGDDSKRFNVGQAVQITGYVFDAKVGGVETSNCKAHAQSERDTHIELVLDASDSGPSRRVIVEVTPRIRALAAKRGLDWSTDALKRDIVGRAITITGWLLFDGEHRNQAENTAPGNPGNWRATSWEVHPITAMRIGSQPIAMR